MDNRSIQTMVNVKRPLYMTGSGVKSTGMRRGHNDGGDAGYQVIFAPCSALVGDAPFRLKSALKVTHPLRNAPISTDFHSKRLNRKR